MNSTNNLTEIKLLSRHRNGLPLAMGDRAYFPDLGALRIKMLARRIGGGQVSEGSLMQATRMLDYSTAKEGGEHFPDLERVKRRLALRASNREALQTMRF